VRILVIAAAVGLSVVGLSAAGEARSAIRQNTQIEAQELGPALESVARQYGYQILYCTDLVATLRTNGAAGLLTAEEALQEVLSGTGLSYRYLAEKAVTVVPAEPGTARPRATSEKDEQSPESFAGRLRLAQAGPAAATVNSVPPSSKDSAPLLAEVVVTGTHVSRPGFDAPTPTTVIGEQILETRAPAVLIDALRYLPQMRGAQTTDSAGQASLGPGGQSFINLRALGANRSLVLVNGQRMIATSNTETIDISVLPQALIKRVDMVTGGASAAYGSDAVAGVVNFVLDTKYEGLKGNLEGGTSAHGDDTNYKASLVYGTAFADNLHLVASGEYYGADGLKVGSRDFYNPAAANYPNPAYVAGNGQLALIRAPGYYAYLPNQTWGGLIVGGPLAGTQFLPGGATSQVDYSNCPIRNSGSTYCATQQGLPWAPQQNYLATPVQRGSGFVRLTDDITSDVSVFADAMYGRSRTTFQTVPFNATSAGTLTINNDNAYLPQSIKNQMAADNITSFQLGRYSQDDGPTVGSREVEVKRGSIGMQANLWNNWKLTPYVSYAQSKFTIGLDHTWITSRYKLAADAVVDPNNGQIVCRSTLTNPNNGCVPVNLFGDGSTSAAAHSYYLGNAQSVLTNKLVDAGGNLTGDVFSDWAGPVSLALGGEFRHETDEQVVDAISAMKGFGVNNPAPSSGGISVREGYVETVVPLAKDLALAKSADLDVAGRVTSYSTSGTVETWKLGLNYAPIADARLRLTRSRDIRAPNVLELFSPVVQTSGAQGVTDPKYNLPTFIKTFSGGNNRLVPEIAYTSTVGVVLQPTELPELRASLDYYNIKIKGAIGTVALQDVLNGCQAGQQAYCALEVRDANDTLTSVTSSYLNLSEITTSGYDFEADYHFGLDRLRAGWEGALTLHAIGNYVPDYTVSSRNGSVQEAGDLQIYQLPKWSWDLSADYSWREWNWLIDANVIGGGNYANSLIGRLENNAIGPVWYLNTALQRSFKLADHSALVYFNVDNITSRRPPFGYAVGGGINGGPAYDRIGARFKLGVRMEL
jgi:outer membrane receptor protein involved in Fe transport